MVSPFWFGCLKVIPDLPLLGVEITERILRYWEFYTTSGKMLTSESIEDQEKANKYKNFLRLCGKSIYEHGELTKELIEKTAINVNEY